MRTDGRLQTGYRLVGGLDPDVENRGSSEAELRLINRSSISGHERNRLFLSQRGKRFIDLSSLSGLDHAGDSRAFALLDFDRDGWLDVAVVGANAPLLQLFRNRIGDRTGASQALALRFVGGNHAAGPDSGLTNRDGFGATATVDLGELQLVREHRAGEGFAAQNRSTLLVGIGGHSQARSLTVRWPSGRTHETAGVPAGTLVTAYEDPAHSPTGETFTFEPYAASGSRWRGGTRHPADRLELAGRLASGSRLQIFTTMATWCQACRRELPQLRRLRAELDSAELAMFGVPVDETDDRQKLEAYAAETDPAYRLLLDLDPREIAEVEARVVENLYHDALPSTLITDGEGRILQVMAGVPTVSDLRRWSRRVRTPGDSE